MDDPDTARTVLMVTIGYPPDQIGGTEIYVQGLVEALKDHRTRCAIAYVEPFEDAAGPGVEVRRREFEGTPVHVVRVNRACLKLEFSQLDAASCEPVLRAFEQVVDAVAPDVVHVHPLTLGLESYVIERLRRRGERVVLTYHSSTTGCVRGDLVYLGREVCDGKIRQQRCSACLYHKRGAPLPVAHAAARLPLALHRAAYRLLGAVPGLAKLRSFCRIPLLIEANGQVWDRAMRHAHAVVAVCHWVRDVLTRNGVPAEKVTLSRHGLRATGRRTEGAAHAGPACFGFLGRVGREKGITVLLDALAGLPADAAYRFEFCSATFRRARLAPDEQALVDRIRRLAAADPRVVVLDYVPDDQLGATLARWDALVVPSLWLESGPQVVYEAFGVQTPVIGSDLGGIGELVAHGQTGLLVPPNDVPALRDVLLECVREPQRLRSLRGNLREVRTTAAVAADMSALYDRVLQGAPRPAPAGAPS